DFGCLAFDAAVPRTVIVRAVFVPLAVCLVVLGVVRDEILQCKAVVGRHEVDRRHGSASGMGVEIARTGQPRREFTEGGWFAAPKVADRVAVLPVPLAPERGEVTHLV